jgi:RNA polymerase sigma-70 factor (ECF subfamily)
MRWGALTSRESVPARPTAAAFEQVVLPHLDAAHNLARWLVRDPTRAEDVVQDAVLRALSYFASYHGGDGRAWFLRIVRNVAYSALAARPRNAVSLDGDADGPDPVASVADGGDDPEQALAKREALEKLDEALAALPVMWRECLVLRELEELSYQEIAAVVGVPIGTVMSRLWRARRALLRGQGGGLDE